MAQVQIDPEKFFQRLQRLVDHWSSQRTTHWGGADVLCICSGAHTEEANYTKSSAMQLYLFGYEIPDSIFLVTKNAFWFMATEKKCKLVAEPLIGKSNTFTVHALERSKDAEANRDHFTSLLSVVRKSGGNKIGSIFKTEYAGTFIPSWFQAVDNSGLEKIEISTSVGLFLAVKEESELELSKRAAVMTNKVMKHGFVAEMETILDNDSKMKHDELGTKVEKCLYDPSLIGLKIASDLVGSCFTPIIQSGGKYDIRVSAASNSDNLSADIILCSLGAKYKEYCANISRTFMVDAPKKVETTYGILLDLFSTCMDNMTVGKEYKDVYSAATKYLTAKAPELLANLPKSLGFAIGLQFRDSTLVINDKNTTKFVDGMVMTLAVGFHNVPLNAEDKKGAVAAYQGMDHFSLLVADTVRIQKEGIPDVLTKFSKEFGDVSYNIAEGGKEDDEDEEENSQDEKTGRRMMETSEGMVRRSARHGDDKAASDQAASVRSARQAELMKKRLAEAQRRLSQGGSGRQDSEEDLKEAQDLETYNSVAQYPRDAVPYRVSVDLDREAVLLPINGQIVPFHISTIKSMSRPDEDPNKATWMRVGFVIPGGAAAKDVPKNMQQLVLKYGDTEVFIKEMTFRSLDSKSLTDAHQAFQELRKRVKMRDQKAEQEKDLVVQQKLIRIKDQRVPRLQDLNMRPSMTGRKTVGSIEAHQNGLRFLSTKSEILDIMYDNIKSCIYQPCDRTTMVLIHFHLKNFILVGKKKQKDIQFYTEVIDASLNLEGTRRSAHDIDEITEEQQERELRKRLNLTFKEFCQKLEKVASHYGHNLQVDVPFRKSGFEGTCNKEMVFLQPTTHCLVNLTEVPPFVLTLSDIEHAHFERVSYTTKNFDLTFIFKDWNLPPRTITAIDLKSLDTIQDWLNLVEITYTVGARSMNWVDTMIAVRESAEFFYRDIDFDGEKKPPGWLFLSGEPDEDENAEEEDEDGDDNYSGDSESSEDSESESESDEYEESEDEDEYTDEDDLEEQGKDWDELERDASLADKRKEEREDDDAHPKKMQKKR